MWLLAILALPCLWLALCPRFALRFYEWILFQPSKHRGDPAALQLVLDQHHGRRVEFTSQANNLVRGYLLGDIDTCRSLMLYIIGRDGDIATRADMLKRLMRSDSAILIYDPVGFGDSKGRPTLRGVCGDALAAYDYASTLVEAKKIVVYGESLGGSIAAWLSTQRVLTGIVVKSTFYSLVRVVKELTPLLRFYPRALYPTEPALNTAEELSRQAAPVLIMHGKCDKMVKYRHAVDMHERIGEKSELLSLPDARHAFLPDADAELLVRTVCVFVDRLLPIARADQPAPTSQP